MAEITFPTTPTGARVLHTVTTTATKTFPNLSSLTKNSGDLLLAICVAYQGNSTNAEFSAWGGSFTEFVDQASTTTMAIGAAYKWSTGSETGTFTVTSANTTSTHNAVCWLLSIPGAHASTIPEATAIANSAASPADPGALNPANWDSEDTLWVAVAGFGETATAASFDTITAAPTNYTDMVVSALTSDSIGGVWAAVAFRPNRVASENVATFTGDVSNARNSALLIAVRPAIPDPPSVNPGDIRRPVPRRFRLRYR